jgi:ribosomal protein S18 acetylase RimI-like enzyme
MTTIERIQSERGEVLPPRLQRAVRKLLMDGELIKKGHRLNLPLYDGIWFATTPAKEVVGMVAFRMERGRCYLCRLAVNKAHRRQGIGRRLVRKVTALRRGRRVIAFTNFRKFNWWSKTGFVHVKPPESQVEKERNVFATETSYGVVMAWPA